MKKKIPLLKSISPKQDEIMNALISGWTILCERGISVKSLVRLNGGIPDRHPAMPSISISTLNAMKRKKLIQLDYSKRPEKAYSITPLGEQTWLTLHN